MNHLSAAVLISVSTVTGLPYFNDQESNNEDKCTDHNGRLTRHGDGFFLNNPCRKCMCNHGTEFDCSMVQCVLTNCSRWMKAASDCCLLNCTKSPAAAVANASEAYWNHDLSFFSSSVDMLLRMLVSGATSLLVFAMLVYMIRHIRRHHMLISVRRTDNYLSCREDGSSVVSRFDHLAIEAASLNLPSFSSEHPAPPSYSSPKPSFSPPAYDDIPPRYEDLVNEGDNTTINPPVNN